MFTTLPVNKIEYMALQLFKSSGLMHANREVKDSAIVECVRVARQIENCARTDSDGGHKTPDIAKMGNVQHGITRSECHESLWEMKEDLNRGERLVPRAAHRRSLGDALGDDKGFRP